MVTDFEPMQYLQGFISILEVLPMYIKKISLYLYNAFFLNFKYWITHGTLHHCIIICYTFYNQMPLMYICGSLPQLFHQLFLEPTHLLFATMKKIIHFRQWCHHLLRSNISNYCLQSNINAATCAMRTNNCRNMTQCGDTVIKSVFA